MSVAPQREMPHSAESEEGLLGCCLMDGAATLNQVITAEIRPDSFYGNANQIIFATMCDLLAAGKPTDPAIVSEALKLSRNLDGCGGYAYLSQLISRVSTTSHVTFFIERIRQTQVLREIILRSTRLVEACFSFEGDMLGEIAPKVELVAGAMQPPRASRTWTQAVEEAEALTRDRMRPPADRGPSGLEISWGIDDFDRVFQPIEPGELIVIGGYTSTGKSSLLRQVLWSIARAGHPAIIETIEVRDTEEAVNLAGHISGVRSRARLHELHDTDQKALLAAYGKMKVKEFAVFHDDHSLSAMLARAKMFKRRTGLVAMGVDYLQIMADVKQLAPGVRPDFAIGVVTSALKRFATSENIAVVLLSGFNRAYVRDGNRPPNLADLEGSSSIEKDASRVLLIDVPSEYTIDGTKTSQDLTADSSDVPRFYVNIKQAKGRNQGTASVGMWFRRETKAFQEIRIDARPGDGEEVPADLFGTT